MPSTQEILDQGKQYLTGNYARLPVVMARGQGSRLWDTDNREYIDLFAGFGGTILGHCHPDLIRATTEQANRLWAQLPTLAEATDLIQRMTETR